MVKEKKAKAKAKKRVKRLMAKKARAKRVVTKKTAVKSVKLSRSQVVKIRGKKAAQVTLEKLGKVTHYFPKVKAAAILILKDSIKLGDEIYVKGHTTDFKEKVNSMQLDHAPIQEGKKGQEIGLLVKSRVRIGDSVYRL